MRVDYNQPFDHLLSRLIPARLHHELETKKTAHPDAPEGGSKTTDGGTDRVQGSHTDTLVVLARLFSNSTPPALTRALAAYEDSGGAEKKVRAPRSSHRAVRLNGSQLARLVEAYEEGANVYELSRGFGIDRRTVSARLKDQGVALRRQPPSSDMVAEMSRLYALGLSAAKVGRMVGVSGDTVLNHLRLIGVARRDPGRPSKVRA